MTLIFFILTKTKVLFETVNKELRYVNEWFLANKLSLNAGKTKYLFFHKPNACDSIPLRLPIVNFNNIEIKRESSVKFQGVTIDENITWNKHMELVENKVSKNIGILYRASHYLDKKKSKKHIFLLYS